MKKIIPFALVLLLLGLCCCQRMPAVEETTAGQTTAEEFTTEETTTEEPVTEEPGEEEWEEPPAQKIYPISEIDASLGPGPFSVNELAERFGEPKKMTGELIAFPGTDDCVCGLTAEFENVAFELWDGYDEKTRLSYNAAEADDAGTCEEFSARAVVTQADRALRLELYNAAVTGKDIPLPREIHIGDSMEKVLAAYPDAPREWTGDTGGLELFYRYGTPQIEAFQQEGYSVVYGISYCFEDGRLTRAEITWIDAFDRFD